MHPLTKIRVAGYKSIRDQEIELARLNVMIGANGAGKSNLLGVFRLLHEIVQANLQLTVARAGGADRLLHFGAKVTEEMLLHFHFGPNAYRCVLVPAVADELIFQEETIYYQYPERLWDEFLGSGHKETRLSREVEHRGPASISGYVLNSIRSWKLYHFHDTSAAARVKQTSDLRDNERLRPDAGNLAAFLYRLQQTEPGCFRNIVDTVRMMAPFFGTFNLRPDPLNPDKIRLEWREKGSDAYFDAHALSDGTLRFISLATLLLQPELPTTILLDEPELGLHPYAIALLAELFHAAAKRTQLLVSTQSVTLVNQLTPDEILIVDREDGASVFRACPCHHEIGAVLAYRPEIGPDGGVSRQGHYEVARDFNPSRGRALRSHRDGNLQRRGPASPRPPHGQASLSMPPRNRAGRGGGPPQYASR